MHVGAVKVLAYGQKGAIAQGFGRCANGRVPAHAYGFGKQGIAHHIVSEK